MRKVSALEESVVDKIKTIETLQKEKIDAAKKLIQNTDLSNDQIAIFQNIAVETVKKLRQDLDESK